MTLTEWEKELILRALVDFRCWRSVYELTVKDVNPDLDINKYQERFGEIADELEALIEKVKAI